MVETEHWAIMLPAVAMESAAEWELEQYIAMIRARDSAGVRIIYVSCISSVAANGS